MKLALLKRKLFREASIAGGVLLVVAGIAYGTYSWKSSLDEDYKRLSGESSSMQRKISDSKSEKEAIEAAYIAYNNIPQHRLPTEDGIANASSRIRVARPIIEALKERYYFNVLDVTFSGNIAENKALSKKNINVVENDILVEYEGLTDELVLSFIYSLIDELPGYVSLRGLDIRREGDVTQEVIDRVRNNEAMPILVGGEMSLTWSTLKGKPVESPSSPKEAP